MKHRTAHYLFFPLLLLPSNRWMFRISDSISTDDFLHSPFSARVSYILQYVRTLSETTPSSTLDEGGKELEKQRPRLPRRWVRPRWVWIVPWIDCWCVSSLKEKSSQNEILKFNLVEIEIIFLGEAVAWSINLVQIHCDTAKKPYWPTLPTLRLCRIPERTFRTTGLDY